MWGFFDTLHHQERLNAMHEVARAAEYAGTEVRGAIRDQTEAIEYAERCRRHDQGWSCVRNCGPLNLRETLGVLYWTPAFIAGLVCFFAIFWCEDPDYVLYTWVIVTSITFIWYRVLKLIGGALVRLFCRQTPMTPEQIEAARR